MSTDLLFAHFATLATAPDGIPRLRELILQLAVQGKLGTQDAGDEPASKLIGKIQREKSELIEKRKLRENKITEIKKIQEMKFEIPSGWTWQRMGDVVFFQEGPGIRNWQFRTKGVKLLNVSNILSDGRLNFNSSDKYVSEEEVKEKYLQFLIEDKDLLLASSGGSWGKVAWFKDPGYPIILNTSTVRLRFYSEQFAERYLQYFMQTSFFRQQMVSQLVGIQPNFGSTHLGRCYIPLPPLAEQHRIVTKVDRLMALCDELEARQQQERAGCLWLGTASLAGLQNAESLEEFERLWTHVCDAFDLILDCPENVAVLQQTILHLAVQGRLVRQEPREEPANVLLERIKAEKKQLAKEGKIKREHLLQTVQENESPYLIPKGWKWVSLSDIFLDIRSGGTPSKNNPQFWDGDIYWASVKDLKNEKYLESTQDKITQMGLDECRSKLIPPGNLIICVRMGLGKIAINKIPLAINQDLKAADLSKNIDINYFYYFYRAQTVIGAGMTVNGIRQEKLLQMPFPLPPLAEQHRIVAKVDALMALCDALESRLKERAGVQGRLAGAVVKAICSVS